MKDAVVNQIFEDVNSNSISSVVRDDDISKLFGRLNKLLVHRFQSALVAIKYLRDISSSFRNVAFDAADQTFVRVGVDKNFDVK